ncbi:2-C-methyl-D-erythritol 4-phosphate cytidylyltransferase [Cellulosimicrobium terreum]|nr:2-C-methyl-D-erythritol 4-phosphate cytidylyltransferase [Cellulosimicrobium terreum]
MYSLLLLNGGVGARVAAGQPKQLIKVNGIPILVYSLVAADAVPQIDQIVLNYPEGWREDVEKVVTDYAIKTPVVYVPAGSSRHESVALLLEHVTNDDVVIHESARPLVETADFARLVAAEHRNVSLMLEIPFTVAPVDPGSHRVTGYLERATLRNVQLPQKFSRADLEDAHAFARREDRLFTEDATLVAVAGHDVRFVDGSDRNIKVTTPTDVRLATYLLTGGEDDWNE